MPPTTKTRYYTIVHHAINDKFIIQSSFTWFLGRYFNISLLHLFKQFSAWLFFNHVI